MKNTITDFCPEAVVIDAGKFPTNPIALNWLDRCERIVCCDGATNNFSTLGYPIWRIVGDCDSLHPDIRERYKSIIRQIPDQETNDQTKAVSYLHSKGVSRIVIIGATGEREDHSLGNISLLTTYLEAGIDARIYTDYGVFIAVKGTQSFLCPRGTKVSIFNFGAREMSSEGLRYPIRPFTNWWQGTLNDVTANTFTIRADGIYLVFINY